MIEFTRYPHVGELIQHYAISLNEADVVQLIKSGVSNEEDAELFSLFIWRMLDQMSEDTSNNIKVLGSVDNSSMVPDIDYEVSLYLAENGFEEVWERICNEN